MQIMYGHRSTMQPYQQFPAAGSHMTQPSYPHVQRYASSQFPSQSPTNHYATQACLDPDESPQWPLEEI